MAMLSFRPTPFFANKNRAFWNLQLAGWGGAFVLRGVVALANGQPLGLLLVIMISMITGFSISLILSVIYRQLIDRSPLVTWGTTMLVLAVAVAVFAFIDAWVQDLYSGGASEIGFAQRIVGLLYLDLTLLGAWSALYYAINYFLQLEEQADRLERLEAQATSAQLAMLRYQLNPHFLFNTLNSISTLVLLKETAPANAMLTRLSAFLRHTLVSTASGKVTLAQEVETLKLYLDIERMRFEERLRTEFAIDDDACDAQLPSLLLQPLVENAIKYAVSPQEEGARIRLEAKAIAGRLRLTVSDTGPGMATTPPPGELPTQTRTRGKGTGVGLANIRDRLQQAYGPEHRFEIRNMPGGGFTVLIEIPHEAAEQSAPPAAQPAPPKVATSLALQPATQIGTAA